jgi:hypothetical protein
MSPINIFLYVYPEDVFHTSHCVERMAWTADSPRSLAFFKRDIIQQVAICTLGISRRTVCVVRGLASVTLHPDSATIAYDPKLRQFQYFGESDERFQSIAYVNFVTSKGVTDSAVLLAFTSAEQHPSTSVATIANRGQSAGASQNVRDRN